MQPKHLQILRSPVDKGPLDLSAAELFGGRIKSGVLKDRSGNQFPIVNFIPRFVPSRNYCENFSVEWERHPDVLLPSEATNGDYRDRFWRETAWPTNLQGETILEAGCGPGSFTGVALSSGATVVSFDLSASVDQNYRFHGAHPNLLIVQASIVEMPFAPGTFDRVFCFGVLQHTPDPKRSFISLVEVLKPGGAVASDIYVIAPETHAYTGLFRTKYFLRRWLPRGNAKLLYALVRGYVSLVWPLTQTLSRHPRGIRFNRCLLIDDYATRLPQLETSRRKEFAILDVYDMLSPAYDLPQTIETFIAWHREAGLAEVDVHRGYNGLEGRGVRPNLNSESE